MWRAQAGKVAWGVQDRISGFWWGAGMPADSLWKEHLPSSFGPLGVQPPGPGRAGAHTPAPLSTRPWGAPRPHNLGLLFLCAPMGTFQGQCPGPNLHPDGGPDGWGLAPFPWLSTLGLGVSLFLHMPTGIWDYRQMPWSAQDMFPIRETPLVGQDP